MEKIKYIPLIDNGHGGLIKGIYQTAGKRSPLWDKGVLYEGVFNRQIASGVIKLLLESGIPYGVVAGSDRDIPLHERVKKANQYYLSFNKKAYLFSIHANAGGGTGWEIFTSPGLTKSDKISDIFISKFKNLPIPHRADWRDGDGDKEAEFYVLTRTKCPTVLMEYGFMDNKIDYDLLQNPEFRNICINLTFQGMYQLYTEGI